MKYNCDYKVKRRHHLGGNTYLLVLSPVSGEVPMIEGGQFVNVQSPDKSVFLRRPISVCFVDHRARELWLLVKAIGKGTDAICDAAEGECLSIVGPLGRGFSLPKTLESRTLLIGGGVGIAPLLYWGKILRESGREVAFLLGGRTHADIPLLEDFKKYGEVFISTEDGSLGEKGLVTANSCMNQEWESIQTCGPLPMMKAVAAIARGRGIECEVSLENKMACGIGACLCCVEDTTTGNRCVCTEGPVFNIKELKW